jgi:hypothetical protein
MASNGIRMTVRRFMLIAGLGLALLIGSVALGPVSDAAAQPMSCSTALSLARANISIGNLFLAWGDPTTANFYFGKAQAYMDFC